MGESLSPAHAPDKANPTDIRVPEGQIATRVTGRIRDLGRLVETLRSGSPGDVTVEAILGVTARALGLDAAFLLELAESGRGASKTPATGPLECVPEPALAADVRSTLTQPIHRPACFVGIASGLPRSFPRTMPPAGAEKGPGLLDLALRSGEPVAVHDLAGGMPRDSLEAWLAGAGARTAVVVPLRTVDAARATPGDARLASEGGPRRSPVLVAVSFAGTRAIGEEEREVALLAVDCAGLALERHALRQAAEAAVTAAAEAERRRIAREIHDGVAQSVGAAALEVERLALATGRDGRSPTAEDLGAVAARLGEAFKDLRNLSRYLNARPPEVGGAPRLLGTVREHLEGARRIHPDLAVETDLGGLVHPLPLEVEHEVGRIIQEALANVVRHASARRVRVEARRHGDRLSMVVEDDGRGFTLPAATPATAAGHGMCEEMAAGCGLVNMRERARLLGGDLRVDSRPGRGTRVELSVPVGGPSSERASGS